MSELGLRAWASIMANRDEEGFAHMDLADGGHWRFAPDPTCRLEAGQVLLQLEDGTWAIMPIEMIEGVSATFFMNDEDFLYMVQSILRGEGIYPVSVN